MCVRAKKAALSGTAANQSVTCTCLPVPRRLRIACAHAKTAVAHPTNTAHRSRAYPEAEQAEELHAGFGASPFALDDEDAASSPSSSSSAKGDEAQQWRRHDYTSDKDTGRVKADGDDDADKPHERPPRGHTPPQDDHNVWDSPGG